MSDYCESPEFYSETRPVARTPHRCCECEGAIQVGERYVRCAGKFDGSMYSYAQHADCRDFAAEVNKTYGDGECFIAFEGVNEEIANARNWCPDVAQIAILRQRWAMIRAAGRGEMLG